MMSRSSVAVAVWMLVLSMSSLAAETSVPGTTPKPVPLIDVTDLYHPHQDVGDNFDILAAYALPELDLRAVILDCTEPFRQPVAKDPGPGLFPDARGPREPGFIPVLQLNYAFGRNVPCATIPFARMKSINDKMLDAPPFQQQGIELILKTLRESAEPVHIVSFGSARAIAVAYNRDPALFRTKLARLHLCAGGSSPPAPGYIEWNVALDPLAIVCLLRSDLPIALYPDAANNAGEKGYGVFSPAFSYDEHNTFWKLPDLSFIPRMDPPLRRYLEYAFSRSSRADFLRAMEADGPPLPEATPGQGTLRLGNGGLDLCQWAETRETSRRDLPHCSSSGSPADGPGTAQRTPAVFGHGPGRRHLRIPGNQRAYELLGLLPRRPARERSLRSARPCRRSMSHSVPPWAKLLHHETDSSAETCVDICGAGDISLPEERKCATSLQRMPALAELPNAGRTAGACGLASWS